MAKLAEQAERYDGKNRGNQVVASVAHPLPCKDMGPQVPINAFPQLYLIFFFTFCACFSSFRDGILHEGKSICRTET